MCQDLRKEIVLLKNESEKEKEKEGKFTDLEVERQQHLNKMNKIKYSTDMMTMIKKHDTLIRINKTLEARINELRRNER